MFEFSRNLRGAFIDQAIWIDVILTDILARYFVSDKDKRMLFNSDVLTGRDSTFSGRIDILEKVVNKSFADFKKQNTELFKKLDKIRRFRNKLAHAHLDTSENYLSKNKEDMIQLVFYEDGIQKTQSIKFEELKLRLVECSDVVKVLLWTAPHGLDKIC